MLIYSWFERAVIESSPESISFARFEHREALCPLDRIEVFIKPGHPIILKT